MKRSDIAFLVGFIISGALILLGSWFLLSENGNPLYGTIMLGMGIAWCLFELWKIGSMPKIERGRNGRHVSE